MTENNYKVLIVEDDDVQMMLLENTLKKVEVTDIKLVIEKAGNYDNAVRVIKENYPDLILLDIVLVGLSGLYIAAYITAYAINHDLPKPRIVFISGNLESKDSIVHKANLLGATFLWKPIDVNVLTNLVGKFVEEMFSKEFISEDLSKEKDSNKAAQRFTAEDMALIQNLEHYVAHLIMELQFFRTKSKDMGLGTDEERFLDEMSDIESKTIAIFNQFKKQFL